MKSINASKPFASITLSPTQSSVTVYRNESKSVPNIDTSNNPTTPSGVTNAVFTADTCSPDTLVSLVAVYMYPVSTTKLLSRLQDSLVSAGRTLLRTCIRLHLIRRHVDGVARPGYFYPATCIWHSDINAEAV